MQQLMINGTVRRVVLVVLDGLRPDAITQFGLQNVLRLARNGASTFDARTVSPSVTAAAMGSLLTGAEPARHGVQSDRFHIPRTAGPIHPVAHELARAGMPSSGYMAHVPWLMRGLAHRMVAKLGFGTVRFRGVGALEILASARASLRDQRTGLLLMHWPDADDAGHKFGWMSPQYAEAARTMDAALGLFMKIASLDDPSTLVVVLADHGGGGRTLRGHNSDHELDRTIPLIFAGAGVRPATLGAGLSLVDVPATILTALGLPVPASYAGRSLLAPRRLPATAAVLPRPAGTLAVA